MPDFKFTIESDTKDKPLVEHHLERRGFKNIQSIDPTCHNKVVISGEKNLHDETEAILETGELMRNLRPIPNKTIEYEQIQQQLTEEF